jgi:hypothetical protein
VSAGFTCGNQRFFRPVAFAAAAASRSRAARQPASKPEDWLARGVVGYRLLSKDDFRPGARAGSGGTSISAEICVQIVPTEDHEQTGAFRAVMKPECSFWNDTVGPLGTLGGLAGASVLPGIPTQQPDWYTLQHEQIHFAIMEVAARRLSTRIAEIPAADRTAPSIESAYRLTLSHTQERHAKFDAETSGTFDPGKLGLWVRVLETEMRRLCGRDARCWVRHRNPLGWGDG